MKALRYVLRFIEENTPQSSARVCAVLCCIAGCAVALQSPTEWQTVTALIGGGTVALHGRKNSTPPTDTPT